MENYVGGYRSPLGPLMVIATDKVVSKVVFAEEMPDQIRQNDLLAQCLAELAEYFAGRRREFTVLTAQPGTTFQQKVWSRLCDVPYGTTAHYQDIAAALGNIRAVRATGGAVGRNQLVIIVPCHRIVKKGNAPENYGGGVWRKEWLLQHEQRFS